MSLTEFKPESTSPSLAGPSRKRPRSEMSSEDRKEARAHRNRIAAQNSRDRRKAQFVYLEQRILELEEENKRLRVGVPPVNPHQDAKTKENQELRARILTLERGLEAVVKAFAVQGLPSSLAPPPASSEVTPPETETTSSEPVFSSELTPELSPSVSTSSISSPSSTASPVLEPFPLSPSPSTASLDLSFGSSIPSPSSSLSESELESTRHLAAGELDVYSYAPIKADGTDSELPISPMEPVDDATMETLFHEILYSHSRSPSPEPARIPETVDAGAATTESLQAADLLAITGQIQAEQETQTSAGFTPAQVSARSLEGVKVESSREEDAETQLASLGVSLDELESMKEDGFGMGLDIEMSNGSDFLEENAGFSSGFTATWLDDYASSMLEGLVPSTLAALQTDSSATLEMSTTSWESLEASLSLGVGVF